MKLILAIVSGEDSNAVTRSLNENGYFVTKLSTTGSFLAKGNSTLIIGCEEDKVDKAIELIGAEAKTRTETIVPGASFDVVIPSFTTAEVRVGGATIFVLDVEKFIKL